MEAVLIACYFVTGSLVGFIAAEALKKPCELTSKEQLAVFFIGLLFGGLLVAFAAVITALAVAALLLIIMGLLAYAPRSIYVQAQKDT